ncbi:MAG TPA: AMP-binding protein [Nitriliruptorales bacterium]
MPVPDQLRLLVAEHPEKVAYRLVHPGGEREEVTFGQWDADASRLARGLVDRGFAKGDIVGGLFTQADALQQIRAYAGIHKAGGVHVPVNAKFTPGEVAQVLAHAEPRWLVVTPSLAGLVDEILDRVPTVQQVISTGRAFGDAAAWADVLADDATDIQVDVSEDDMCDILYTSGTTGRPKGVLLRHRTAFSVEPGRPDWNGMGWFHASPMFTTAGLSFVYVPMRLGMTANYMSRFDAATFLDLAESRTIQMCFLVPAFVEMILAEPDIEERDLSGMFMVTVGSAPIAPAALSRLQQLMPQAMISNAFGMTESGSANMALPVGELEKRPGSVGKPTPPVEVRIIGEDGSTLAAGEIGEVCLRNPGQEREYYKDPEATALMWRDGWLHTGDLGRVDEDGFLYIVGRIKDVIIRGGHNVHAADVEGVLYEHPDVREAAVVGVPHEVLGEEVAAAVVLVGGAGSSAEDLVTWCKQRVAGFAYPRTVTIVTELPRNATGKVLKKMLAEQLTASTG